MAKIAVIGAGLFGTTIAIELGKNHLVDLYEQEDRLFPAASGINQFRLHRGYHYPRSAETAKSSLEAEKTFKELYGETIIQGTENYYAISKKDSLTSAKDYLAFCRDNNLNYTIETLDLIKSQSVDLTIKVDEYLIDPEKIKNIAIDKIKASKVNLILSKKAEKNIFKNYDFVVLATYASLNRLLFPKAQKDYQFEVCEKIVVDLPKEFKNKSIVILDGPFMCIDPYGNTGLFLMGNVVHAIWETNIGKLPKISKKLLPLLNRGVIENPSISNFKKFIESTEKFMPKIKEAKYVGSMYTIRTVLPFKEDTDERPTLVERIDDKIFTVFSGKMASCVSAAREINCLIEA